MLMCIRIEYVISSYQGGQWITNEEMYTKKQATTSGETRKKNDQKQSHGRST